MNLLKVARDIAALQEKEHFDWDIIPGNDVHVISLMLPEYIELEMIAEYSTTEYGLGVLAGMIVSQYASMNTSSKEGINEGETEAGAAKKSH